MKNLLLPVLAASALLLGACSSQKLAQDSSDDDVYFTSAKAKEIPVPVASSQPQKEKSYKTDEQLYGGGNYTDQDYYDDYNYDYGYASRLNRFYGRSPWRSAYYDSWYSYGYYPWYTYRYDPFFYDPWYYSPGTSIWVGIGSYPRYGWYDNYYWRYYGSYYNSPYWGPYSYNNVYPGYYGGGYYGGYSSGRTYNQRPRPNRESGIGRSPGNSNSPSYSDPRVNSTSGRPSRYGDDRIMRTNPNQGRTQAEGNGNSNTSSRPSRGEGSISAPRQSSTPRQEPTRTEYSRPERSNTPSYDTGRSSGSSSSGGGNSGSTSSGGGSSSGGGRPSRGGR